MESYFLNGGMIGATLDFRTNDRYIISTTVVNIEVVGTPTKAQGSTTLTLPTGIQDNDIIFIAGFDDSSSTLATPSGYTQLHNNSGSFRRALWYKVANGEGSSVTGLTSQTDGGYACFVLRGVNPFIIFDAPYDTFGESGTGMPNATAITTTTDNATVIAIGYLDDDVISAGAPSGYTLITSATFGASGNGGTIMAAMKSVPVAGVEDPGAFTGGDDANYALTLAVRKLPDSIVYGNYKNSGIWSLPAVIDALYVKRPRIIGYSTNSINGVNSTTLTLNYPNDLRDGDVVLFALKEEDNRSITFSDAGWTVMIADVSSGRPLIVYKNTVAASDSGNSFTVTFASATDNASAAVVAIRDADYSFIGNAADSGNETAAGITLTQDNSLVFFIGGNAAGEATSVTPPFFFTQLLWEVGNNTDLFIGYRYYNTAQFTGDITYTENGASTTTYLVGVSPK